MEDGATPVLLIGSLVGISTSYFVAVARAPFRVGEAQLAFVGQLLLLAAVGLLAGAIVPSVLFRTDAPLPLLFIGLLGLILAFPMTTIGLVRLLNSVTGPWHHHLEQGLWGCFGAIAGSILLLLLVGELDLPGPGSHSDCALMFAALGFLGGVSGLFLLSLVILSRIHRASQPVAETSWIDANGHTVSVVELRGGHSLVHDTGGGVTLEPSLDAERRLTSAGYLRR